MRAPLFLVALVAGTGFLLVLQEAPLAEAAPLARPGDVVCQRYPSDQVFAAFQSIWPEYCAFQPAGAFAKDVSYREGTGNVPPANDGIYLTISGESEKELSDSRDWTELAFLRFPDWQKSIPKNASARYGFVLLWYDQTFYDEHSELQEAKTRPLFGTDLLNEWEHGTSWNQIEGDSNYYVNKSGAIPDGVGGISAVFQTAFNLGGASCDNSASAPCRFLAVENSGFFGSSCNPAFACTKLLEDTLRGRKRDYGFAILDDDFLQGQPGDAGTCRDPTHPPAGTNPSRPATTPPPAASTCPQVFYSSDYPNNGNLFLSPRCADPWVPSQALAVQDGAWVCWPKLVVHFDRNAPRFDAAQVVYNATRANLLAPTGTMMSGVAVVNLSVDLHDNWGGVTEVRFTVERSEEGVRTRLFEDVPLTGRARNETRSPLELARCQCETWQYWRRAPLELPAGRYWVNFTALDTDNNRAWRNATAGRNLVVNETAPRLDNVRVPERSFAHKGVLNFTVAATSSLSPIDLVWAEIRRVNPDNTTGDVVRTTKLRPWEGAFDRRTKLGDWTFGGPWGRFDPLRETPGLFSIRFYANDSVGRLGSIEGGRFRVVDTLTPQIQSHRIGAPATGAGETYLQEEGGTVVFEVEAFDPENPLPLAVEARLARTGAATIVLPLERRDGNRYSATLPAPAPGTWQGTLTARDADNLSATRTFSLVSVPQGPPVFRSVAPVGWGNLTPVIGAEIFDYTADPSKVRVFVGDPTLGALPEKSAIVRGTAPVLTVEVTSLGTLRHGQSRQVRVEATDALGNVATRTWDFRVDALAPARTELSVGDPKDLRAGRYTVKPETPFSLAGSDSDSGLAKVEVRLVHLQGNQTGDWATYAGPFVLSSLPGHREAGRYRLEFRATDVAGNREVVRSEDVTLDVAAPALSMRFDGLVLGALATDDGGIARLTIHYRNFTTPTWTTIDVPIADPLRVESRIGLGAVPRGAKFLYHAEAVDRLGNRVLVASRERPIEAVSPNHAPLLRVDLPDNGTTVLGLLRIPWNAPDVDGDGVRVAFQLRPILLAESRDLDAVSGTSGTFAWNTTQWPDGPYEFLVTASDGTAVATVSARLEVRNTASGVADLVKPQARVEFTDPAVFRATIYKPVREAIVRIVDAAGNPVADIVLKDDGRGADAVAGDRVYSGAYTPLAKGAYSSVLHLEYENEAPRDEDLGSFTVESSVARALQRNALAIGLGTLVVLAVGAAVVVQLVRYGYLFPQKD